MAPRIPSRLLLVVVASLTLAGARPGTAAVGPRGPARPRSALSSPQVIARIRPSVVTVLAGSSADGRRSQGSGVVVRSDGVVATAWHLIGGATSVLVQTVDGRQLPAEGLLAWDREQDWALVKVAAKGMSASPLARGRGVERGERVLVVSSPLGLEQTICDGLASGVRRVRAGGRVLQIAAPLSPGSSGGPVYNQKGEVVGILSSQLEGAQGVAFATPIDWMRVALPKARSARPLVDVAHELRKKAETRYRQAIAVGPTPWYLDDVALEPGVAGDAGDPDTRRRLEAALPLLLDAVSLYPGYGDAQIAAAYCLLGLGRTGEALQHYRRAASLDLRDVLAWGDMAQASGLLGRWEEAISYCRQTQAGGPDQAGPAFGLAVSYRLSGRSAEASEAFTDALLLSKGNALDCFHIGRQFEALGDTEGAASAYRQAVQADPDLSAAHLFLAGTYEEAGRWEEALAVYDAMVGVSPALAHSGKGNAYQQMGKTQEACNEFRLAAAADPGSADAHARLGETLAELGDLEGALAELRKAEDIDPDDAQAIFALGAMHCRKGDRGLALAQYRKLKDRDAALAEQLFGLIYP